MPFRRIWLVLHLNFRGWTSAEPRCPDSTAAEQETTNRIFVLRGLKKGRPHWRGRQASTTTADVVVDVWRRRHVQEFVVATTAASAGSVDSRTSGPSVDQEHRRSVEEEHQHQRETSTYATEAHEVGCTVTYYPDLFFSLWWNPSMSSVDKKW